VTYGAESWILTNEIKSLNDVEKENTEKNIWNIV